MEIIYLSDVHDAFDRVKDLLSATDGDCYLIAGDLVDRPFFTATAAAAYRQRQGAFARLRRRLGLRDQTLDQAIAALAIRADIPDTERLQILAFHTETIRGRRVMQQKYKILESILRRKDRATLLCLPGNYDMDLQYTSLHHRDLHRHWYQVGPFRIAGYGGADVFTPG
ncbi:MAG: metallophosphoesterase, partial [Syntrophales bacterium]|nr:metallophosphoesterase [Syntrophales bacterium]